MSVALHLIDFVYAHCVPVLSCIHILFIYLFHNYVLFVLHSFNIVLLNPDIASCLFVLMLYVPVNIFSYFGMLPCLPGLNQYYM